MKTIALHLVLVGCVYFYACRYPEAAREPNGTPPAVAPTDTVPIDPWRRTANGWERRTEWTDRVEAESTRIRPWLDLHAVHPAIWAGLKAGLSVGALVLFSGPEHRRRR